MVECQALMPEVSRSNLGVISTIFLTSLSCHPSAGTYFVGDILVYLLGWSRIGPGQPPAEYNYKNKNRFELATFGAWARRSATAPSSRYHSNTLNTEQHSDEMNQCRDPIRDTVLFCTTDGQWTDIIARHVSLQTIISDNKTFQSMNNSWNDRCAFLLRYDYS